MSTNQLFLRYQPLARQLARGFKRKLPRSVLLEDLEAAAMAGLWDAVNRTNDHDGFEWYVRTRIRGAIIDELRTQDWLPRRARQRNPDLRVFSIEAFDNIDMVAALTVNAVADEMLEQNEQASEVARRIAALPERHRLVIDELLQGRKQREIADDLGVSEPRVCQLRSRALEFLRGRTKAIADKSTRARRQRATPRPKPAPAPRSKRKPIQHMWPALISGELVVSIAGAFGCELRRPAKPKALSTRDAAVFKHWLLGGNAKETAAQFALSRSMVSEILKVSIAALGLSCVPSFVPTALAILARADELGGIHFDVMEHATGAISVRIERDDSWLTALSPIEKLFICGLLDGKGRAEITAERGTSYRTVANQITAAYRKLKVSSVSELRALCARVYVEKAAHNKRAA